MIDIIMTELRSVIFCVLLVIVDVKKDSIYKIAYEYFFLEQEMILKIWNIK